MVTVPNYDTIENVSVAAGQDGSFQVFWTNTAPEPTEYEQAYNAAGAPIGSPTTLGPTPIGNYPGYPVSDATYLPIGIDTTQISPILANAATVAEQFNFVGVYLGTHSGVTFTKTMAQELSDENLTMVSIYESAKNPQTSHYTSNPLQNGTSDGKAAFKNAYNDGQNSGSTIYFGVEPGYKDTYGNATLLNDIETYFQGIADGFDAEA